MSRPAIRVPVPARIAGLPPHKSITRPQRGVADPSWCYVRELPTVLVPATLNALRKETT